MILGENDNAKNVPDGRRVSGPDFRCGACGDDAKKIAQDLTDKWVAAYNTGDAKAIAALYTKDALFSNAGAKDFMKGQDAIEQNLAAGIEQGGKFL